VLIKRQSRMDRKAKVSNKIVEKCGRIVEKIE
jgi:hypothetical protein